MTTDWRNYIPRPDMDGNLVSRLRNPNYAKSQTLAASYMNEAADEIERLRTALSFHDSKDATS